MKSTRRTLTAEEREQSAAFHASVHGRPCIVCGATHYVMEAHHGIEAQWLRSNYPEHVYDVRNACPICPWFIRPKCHGDHTSAKQRIRRAALPQSVEDFAAELGATWQLERYYESESEAA